MSPEPKKFDDRFNLIVVLTSPIDVLLDRVANRRSNPFGRSKEDQQTIRQHKREFELLLIAGADLVIDTSTAKPDRWQSD